MRIVSKMCRVHEDELLAVFETFGSAPFTARDLREKGLVFPAPRGIGYFRRAGVVDLYEQGRPNVWILSVKTRRVLKGVARV